MFKRLFRASAILLVAVSGTLLLFSANPIRPESAARERGLRQLGPAQPDSSALIPGLPVGQTYLVAEPAPPVEMVDASLVPAPPDDPVSLWRQGLIDLEEEPSIVSEDAIQDLQDAAYRLAPDPSVQTNLDSAGTGGLQARQHFDSLDIKDCCAGIGATVPPDPELAVGPNHLIAVVNTAFEIYDKRGQTLLPVTRFAQLFDGVTGCSGGVSLFDPNVLYDEATGRWFLAIDGGGSYYCAAVSASGNPLGTWHRYAFFIHPNDLYLDYPQAGIGHKAIFVGANLFYRDLVGEFSFENGRMIALDKAAMYAGQPAAMRWYDLTIQEDTPQPAHLHGFLQGTWPASKPHYFLVQYGFVDPVYSVYSWDDPFSSNPVDEGDLDLPAGPGQTAVHPIPVPQPGGHQTLEANDHRLQDAEFRNGHIWTTDTIACNPGAGTVDCIRWAEIDPESVLIVQAGVFATQGAYRFFGDLAVNAYGDMAIGYTRVDPANGDDGYPGAWVAGRVAGDPVSTLGYEMSLKLSQQPYVGLTTIEDPPYRWGDYTGMASDPNGCDVWYIGQYSKAGVGATANWGTYIGRLAFTRDPGDPPPLGLDMRLYLPVIFNSNPFCR